MQIFKVSVLQRRLIVKSDSFSGFLLNFDEMLVC